MTLEESQNPEHWLIGYINATIGDTSANAEEKLNKIREKLEEYEELE